MSYRLVWGIMLAGCTTVLAQTATNSAVAPSGGSATNQVISSGPLSASNITITNQTGATFSVTDLARQLQTLKASVEQTLPMLTAFNNRFSPANTSSGSQGLAGTISRLFSGGKNNAQGQNQSSSEVSNVVAILHSLLSTNSVGAPVAFNPNTLNQLQTLQRALQPTVPILQNLTSSSGTAGNYSGYGATTNRNGALTPTGR
jgi:hypothetical protein